MWRGLWVAGVGLMIAATARATPTVRYTLSLNEAATGQVLAGRFTIYATVSQGDNDGLFAFGVDLLGSGQVGGPTNLTLINRSPNGTFDVDPTDPNFDPRDVYPTQYTGFGAGRGADASTGIVSGVTDLGKDVGDPQIYGAGQVALDINMFRPPPSTGSGVPVRYGNYLPQAGTDNPIGNPFNRDGVVLLPEGSMRLATGIYAAGGALPTFDLGSVNNKASVWKASHPTGSENELALLELCIRDYSGVQLIEVLPGQSCVVIPEPAALGMFSVALLAAVARGKRARFASVIGQ